MICNTYIQFFKTFCDQSRIEILYHLVESPAYVSELVGETGKEQSSVSHSLRVLREGGFIDFTQEGRKRVYSLTDEAREMLTIMDRHIKKHFHKDCRCGK